MARINGFLTVNGTITTQSIVVSGPTSLTGPATVQPDPVLDVDIVNKKYADTKLSKTGGTLSGPLSLFGSPTDALHAVTKQYVDNIVLNTGGGYRVEVSFIDPPGVEVLRYPTGSSLTPVAAGISTGVGVRVTKTDDIIKIIEESYIVVPPVDAGGYTQYNIPLDKGRRFQLTTGIGIPLRDDYIFNFINCGVVDNITVFPPPVSVEGGYGMYDVEIVSDISDHVRFMGWNAYPTSSTLGSNALKNYINYERSNSSNYTRFKFFIAFFRGLAGAQETEVILDDIVEYGDLNRANQYATASLPVQSIANNGGGLQYPRNSEIHDVRRLSRDKPAVVRTFSGIDLNGLPNTPSTYIRNSYSTCINYLNPTGAGLVLRIASYDEAVTLAAPEIPYYYRPKPGEPIVLINTTIHPITIMPPSDGTVISGGLPLILNQNEIVTLHKIPTSLPKSNNWIYSNPTQYVQANSVSPTGATFTGPVNMAGDPINPLEVATKNYVDTKSTTSYELRATFTNFGDPIVAADANVVYLTAPATGQISLITILTDGGPSGCSIDVFKSTFAGYPMNASDSITNSNYPEIISDTKASVTSFAGWTTVDVIKDEIIGIKLNTSGIFTNIFVSIRVSL